MILWLFGGYPHKSWHYPVSVCDAMKQSEGQVGNAHWSPMKWSAQRITGHILIFNFATENCDATVLVQLVNRPPNIVSDVESEIPSCAGEVPLHLKKIDVWTGECEVKTKTFWQSFANVKKKTAYNIQSRTKIISKKTIPISCQAALTWSIWTLQTVFVFLIVVNILNRTHHVHGPVRNIFRFDRGPQNDINIYSWRHLFRGKKSATTKFHIVFKNILPTPCYQS